MLVFLNGQFVPPARAVVPVNDRGFLYGDGLFETLRVAGGRPFRFAQYLQRLRRGADFLKMEVPFAARDLQEIAGRLIEQNRMPDAILRLTVTRGPGERGYTPKPGAPPTVVMTLHAAPAADTPASWRLVTSSFRVPAADPLSSIKTLNKLPHVLARIEAAEKGADEALLLNSRGEVAETAGGNLFWVDEGRPFTVPTACGALPGVTRAVVLEICQALGVPAGERIIKPDALQNVTGLFTTQSALGVVPVARLDGRPVPPSPLTDQIAGAYREMLAQP
ncbi:MAG: aminotransferase class IV [Verrucomicrobiota bacterium]|nr:aminotransferase class IV [Verrucomicrobiota bacterium]